jgi:hypothetical protein
MRIAEPGRSLALALIALGVAATLSACATATQGAGPAAGATVPPDRWSESHIIQQNQLLPNGLRPLRYFYW